MKLRRLSILFLALSMPAYAQVKVTERCHADYGITKQKDGSYGLSPETVCESSPSDWRE